MRILAAAALALTGCGEQDGSTETARCQTERRVTFGVLPAGILSETPLDGVRIQPLRGTAHVQHGSGIGMLVLVEAEVAFIPDCAAHAVEIVFDASQGEMIVALFPSEFGGEPILSASSNTLPVVPVDSTWDRVRVERGEKQPRIERADLGGGAQDETATSVAVREVTFLPKPE